MARSRTPFVLPTILVLSSFAAAQHASLPAGLGRRVGPNGARASAEPASPSASTPPPSAVQSSSSTPAPSFPSAPALRPLLACPPTIKDASNPNNCIQASSVPTLGMLYPQSTSLNVDGTGNVGVNTTSQSAQLDVNGDLHSNARVALGDLASFGTSLWSLEAEIDASCELTDFSVPYTSWAPVRSYVEVTPSFDLTGANTQYVYGHDLETFTAFDSTNDVQYVDGSYIAGFHFGSGSVDFLSGTGIVTQTGEVGVADGHTSYQVGAWVSATQARDATVDENIGVRVQSGGWVAGTGSVGVDKSIEVLSPWQENAITTHYGLYLADQDVPGATSYALYSDGGASYFAGNVGIGAQPSSYALQVGNPGDGSEARANAWNVLSSCEYKTDVEPLSEVEYDEILAKIEDVDVVHYRYLEDDHRHIGVIAEESPDEILSKDKKGVSLGDYAGFLLAGLKAQQKEIDELRAELAELRAERARSR